MGAEQKYTEVNSYEVDQNFIDKLKEKYQIIEYN